MTYQENRAVEQWFLPSLGSTLFTLDCTNYLSSGATVNAVSGSSGSVTLGVTTTAGSAITVGTPAINSSTITKDDGSTIAVGKAIQVRLTDVSGVVGKEYDVKFWFTTTASNRESVYVTLLLVD